jgi:hypothetical protein
LNILKYIAQIESKQFRTYKAGIIGMLGIAGEAGAVAPKAPMAVLFKVDPNCSAISF